MTTSLITQHSHISLANLSDGNYKIILDEAWYHERPKFKRGNRHWYEMIPCTNGGMIFLYCDKERVFSLVTSQVIGKRVLRAVRGAKMRLKVRHEIEILFPAEALHQVAEIAGARRKRQSLTYEQRAKFIEAGIATQFLGKNPGV